MRITRYERSKRAARAGIVLGVLFSAQFLYVAFSFPDILLAKAPPLTSLAVGICVFLFPVIPVAILCLALRKTASCVEVSDVGIRNPARGEAWLPWDCISEIRRRRFLLLDELVDDGGGSQVRVGFEVEGYLAVLSEVLDRAPMLRERATGRREFQCGSKGYALAVFAGVTVFLFLFVNADFAVFVDAMKVFGPVLGIGFFTVVLTMPIRVRIDDDSLRLSSPMWRTAIPLGEMEDIVYRHDVLNIRLKGSRRHRTIWIGRETLDAYYSLAGRWVAARGAGAVTA